MKAPKKSLREMLDKKRLLKWKKKKNTRAKQKQKKQMHPHARVIVYILVGFSILFAISYRNSLITKNFNTKEELKKELATIQKENAQLQISIQNSLNLTNVEKSAKSMLGMQKLEDSQKIYVSLPKKDYVEPASEQVIVTEEKGWFQKIVDNITNLFQ